MYEVKLPTDPGLPARAVAARVENGAAWCRCGGRLRERVGRLGDAEHAGDAWWLWFACDQCERVTATLPLTPGFAVLITGVLP